MLITSIPGTYIRTMLQRLIVKLFQEVGYHNAVQLTPTDHK